MAAGSFGRLGAGVAGPALAAGAAAAAGVGSLADAAGGENVEGGADVVAEHAEHPVAVSW